MFKWLTRFSLKNGAVIVIAMLMVICGGIYSYLRIPNSDYPNVDVPWIHVDIGYPGATPAQSYQDIGRLLEPKLATIQGVQKLISFSSTNSQSFTLEIDMNRKVKDVDRDIQDILNQVQLPNIAQKPVILNESAENPAVYTFAVTADKSDISKVQSYVDNTLNPTLSAVSGVGEIRVNGDTKKDIFVNVDLNKLKRLGVTWQQVQQALVANNFSSPIGSLAVGQQSMAVVVGGNIQSLDAIRKLPIVIFRQNTSGLKNAFQSVQNGMTTMSSALGQIGSNEGYIQGEVQLMQVIQGMTAQYMADESQLQVLSTASKVAPSTALNQKMSDTAQKLKTEGQQITMLQQQLKQLEAKIAFPSAHPTTSERSTASNPNADPTPTVGAAIVTLGDVADVTYESDPNNRTITRTDGKQGVVVQVLPSTNANTIQVVHDVQQALNGTVLPSGYHLNILDNQADHVKHNVQGMLREAALGALFAVIVTLIFLRDLRATVVAIFSIPLSIFAAVIVMNAVGYSLNMMTLSGMAVAVGRVVDDSIVVIENIYRRLKDRNVPRTGHFIEESTLEVGSAITSSTVTTVAVFLPMTFVPGIVGHFFAPFAWTVIIALSFSLLVALMVVPMVAKYSFLRISPAAHVETRLQHAYRGALRWSLSHKWVVILIGVMLLLESGFAATKLGFNFLPSSRINMFTIDASMNTASTIQSTNDVAKKIESVLSKFSGVKTYQTYVSPGDATIVVFVADAVKDTDAFGNQLRDAVEHVSGAHRITVAGASGPGGNNMNLILQGGDAQKLRQASDMVVNALEKIPGLADVSSSAQASMPQVEVNVDAVKAGNDGLDPMTVAGTIRNMLSGDSVTKVDYNNQSTDVNLRIKGDSIQSLSQLGNQEMTTPTGQLVKIRDVASLSIVKGPTSIARLNQQEYIEIDGTITSKNPSQVTSKVNENLQALHLPSGVTTDQEGAAQAMQQGFTNIGLAMIVSFVLVLIAMLITFGEWAAPLAIVFALPFAIVGGFNGLWITRQPLGMPGMIGFMMLIGILVTNAIVLMDRAKRQMQAGLSVRDALIEAGGVRLRPILMTATATIGALLPLAVTNDAGLISKTLAIVVIGGLVTSTLLTLVIVPIMYEWFVAIRLRFARSEHQQQPIAPQVSIDVQ